jgi:hypothetical protein
MVGNIILPAIDPRWINGFGARRLLFQKSVVTQRNRKIISKPIKPETGRNMKLCFLCYICCIVDLQRRTKLKLNFVLLLAGLFASHGVAVHWRNLSLLFITITSGPHSMLRNVCWTATALMFSFLTLSVDSLVSTAWSVTCSYDATYVTKVHKVHPAR